MIGIGDEYFFIADVEKRHKLSKNAVIYMCANTRLRARQRRSGTCFANQPWWEGRSSLYIRCGLFAARFLTLLNFFAKKMQKYLQVRKKSLPLHPHLRKTRFLQDSKVYSKGAGEFFEAGGCSENARFLKKYLQD